MIEKSRFSDPFSPKPTTSEDSPSQPPQRGSRYERNRVARLMAVQAVYQGLLTQTHYDRVLKNFLDYHVKNHTHPVNPDRALLIHLLSTLHERHDHVAEIVAGMTTEAWSMENMDRVLLAILMTGTTELLSPYKGAPLPVVISEYVEITKGFFDDKEAAYVNKAFDALLKCLA